MLRMLLTGFIDTSNLRKVCNAFRVLHLSQLQLRKCLLDESTYLLCVNFLIICGIFWVLRGLRVILHMNTWNWWWVLLRVSEYRHLTLRDDILLLCCSLWRLETVDFRAQNLDLIWHKDEVIFVIEGINRGIFLGYGIHHACFNFFLITSDDRIEHIWWAFRHDLVTTPISQSCSRGMPSLDLGASSTVYWLQLL